MDHPQMTSKVERCQDILVYTFKRQDLCWEALQMNGNGVVNIGGRHVATGNKDLALVGQYAYQMMLSEQWYQNGKLKQSWNTTQQQKLSPSLLSGIGHHHGLDRCVQMGNGQSFVSPKMMANTVEALIGAVYLDYSTDDRGGIPAVRRVVRQLGMGLDQ